MKFWVFILAALMLPAPLLAQEHHFKTREKITIEPDKAYILVRSMQMPGGMLRGTVKMLPVLFRVLDNKELEDAKALSEKYPDSWKEKSPSNVIVMLADDPYDTHGDEITLLAEVRPGTYVLGGVSQTNWALISGGVMSLSLCLGTVTFEAKAGTIVDLGNVLVARDDAPTDIPELANEVQGKTTYTSEYVFAAAVRPVNASTSVPQTIKDLPREPANYRARRAFPNYVGVIVGRLAPIPGVLDYDLDGEVLDLRAAGETARSDLH